MRSAAGTVKYKSHSTHYKHNTTIDSCIVVYKEFHSKSFFFFCFFHQVNKEICINKTNAADDNTNNDPIVITVCISAVQISDSIS